ncbi:ethylmalonyl-CoA decarboxylase isoform X2 [Leptinotarsa decemlineata]
MMLDLRTCLSELENWKEGKAVILCGEGSNFCSGGDLEFAKASGTPEEGAYMCFFMQDILKRFRKLPLVTVTLVHGPALGGGAELALFSDYILLADDAKLGFVQGAMGIITAWGGSTRLTEVLGRRKALEMLLTAKVYTAQECLDIGLAYKVVNTENRVAEALEFVRTLVKHHYSLVQSYKEVVEVATTTDFENALDFEKDAFSPKWGSDLNREALRKKIKHLSN